MSAAGTLMPMFSFLVNLSDSSYSLIIFMPLTFSFTLLIRDFIGMRERKLFNTPSLVRWLDIAIKALMILAFFLGYLLINAYLPMGQGAIVMCAFVGIAIIVLVICKKIFNKTFNFKLFLSGIGLPLVIPLATVIGVFG